MATKYAYSQIPADAFEALAVNAGILVDSFDPDTRVVGNQLGATTGGISTSCVPSFLDMGDDVDNCPKNTAELINIEGYECGASGTFVTMKADLLARLIGAADVSGTKIVPRMRLKISDFKDLWYICDYGVGGYIAVHLIRALSTAGITIQSTDRNKVKFAFEFKGHSSIADPDTVPMEFYIDGTEKASEGV